MSISATLLGTGHAWPIPQAGCGCDQCASARDDAKERRTRSGLFLQTPAGNVLFDASPDVAHQFEREGLAPVVDRVVISHRHTDHLIGLHDLCSIRRGGPDVLPVYCGPTARRVIEGAFPSLLRSGAERIEFRPWDHGSALELMPVTIQAFETHHLDEEPTMGSILFVTMDGVERRILYATDMGQRAPAETDDTIMADLFVGDGTYLGEGNELHPGTDRVIEIGRDLGAQRIALTHVGHWGLDPAKARQAVPADVAICRDGDDLLSLLP